MSITPQSKKSFSLSIIGPGGLVQCIEEGLKQKTRQNVVVLDWGSRLNAALGNLGVNV